MVHRALCGLEICGCMALDGELDCLVLGDGRGHGRTWPLLEAWAIVDEASGGYFKDGQGKFGGARRKRNHKKMHDQYE